MDICDVLKKDHENVSKLLKKIISENASNSEECQTLFQKVKEELVVHSLAEDEVFYSKLENSPETQEFIRESREDHEIVTQILEDMSRMNAGTSEWLEKANSLLENVELHVKMEEDCVFQRASKILDKEQLIQLSGEFETRKQECLRALTDTEHELRSAS